MDKEKLPEITLEEIVYKATTTKDDKPSLLTPESFDKKSSSFLYLSACTVNVIAFAVGCAIGWTSPVIPKLNGSVDPQHNPLVRPTTSTEESWIAALLHLGGALGPLVAGKAADTVGRKRTLLMISIPVGASYLITIFASTVNLYYFARLIVGFGAGSVFTVLPNYLAEIAQDHNRGTLGCIMGVFLSLGILFDFSVGPLLTVQNFSIACFLPVCLFMIVFGFIIPESPHYLVTKGNNRDAEASLKMLRPRGANVAKELGMIQKNLQSKKQASKFIDLFKTKSVRKGLIISLGMIIFQQFSGINAVFCYMQTIFTAAKSSVSAEMSTLIIGLIQTLTCCLTAFLVDRLGRKILLLLSALFSGISLLALGAYFFVKDSGSEVASISWIPIISLVVYIVAFNIGLGPLPWAVIGELFSTEVKASAASVICTVCFVASFLITLFFPSISLVLGTAESFWIFAVFCLTGVAFVQFVIPETKGKTLEEIQTILET